MAENWLLENLNEEIAEKNLQQRWLSTHHERMFIYFVGGETGPIKIGKAKNVKKRLAGLQTSNPEKLILHGVMIGPAHVETALHSRFAKYRLSGEWFERSDEIVSFIENHTQSNESAFFERQKLRDENAALKKEIEDMKEALELKSKDIASKSSAYVVDRLREEIIESKIDAWHDVIEAFKGVIEVTKNVRSLLSKHEVSWSGEKRVRDDVRTALKRQLDCDWHTSEYFLYRCDDRDDEANALRKYAENWIMRKAYVFGIEDVNKTKLVKRFRESGKFYG